jgi:3-hydroxyacyl-CoA dehydrogenase
MGLGIAQALGATEVEVALCGRTAEAAEAGRERLSSSLRRQVLRGRLDAESEAAILSRVTASDLTREGVAGCALIIESVPEDRTLKTDVLSRIEAAAPDAIVATNTSGLAIAGLARSLRAPERFLGLHFFSPAERMPLVEVVKGPETAETTIVTALAFLEAIGKRPVLVQDGPGFFATRVFAAYLDEAVAMVAEGVAPALIEEAALANGRALGPLAMLDETGIGLNLQQARQARAEGLEPRFCRPLSEPVLARLADSGRVGRRAGGGFFDWPAEGARTPWAGLAAAFPLAAAQPDVETIKLRCSSRKRGRRSAASRKAGSPAPTTLTWPPFSDWASRSASGAFCAGRRTSGSIRSSPFATASRARMASVSRPLRGCANSPLGERD